MDFIKGFFLALLFGAGFSLLLFLAPIFIWLGWNVLGLGAAMGLPALTLPGILLAWVFCWGGAFLRTIVAGIVFLVDPAWLHMSAQVSFPDPSWQNLLAIFLVLCAFVPSASSNE